MKHKILLAVLLLLTCTAYADDAKQLAKVDNYSGVYVFSYCEPVADYEVIGDVSVNGGGSSYYSIGGMSFYSSGELQYNELRNGLIVSAVMANRSVDGIIIHPTKVNSGRATMIKFKEGTEKKDRELAYVYKKSDYYIFVDCKPVSDYTYQGKRRARLLMNGSSESLIGAILTNTKNLSRDANAIIVHFTTNGYDYAEAITIKED